MPQPDDNGKKRISPKLPLLGKFMLLRALSFDIDPTGLPAELAAVVQWWATLSVGAKKQLIHEAAGAHSSDRRKALKQE